ncbi:uncharacterized protein LOC116432749 isoform X2 [Nomia melanderi]|uniref:uncharacterized protein LOC116432749 isoform X2 n=1 Tax=Nomia melanderi TaxID=2448451 RepID=UPI0013041107|nr:uncharacterized protein LOC116432749 isoform X2 [Nomia melanderi]
MTEENAEICGFLDVKYLSGKYKVHKVRKRTLAPWKVWRRHWCSIRRLGPGLGVRIQLDYNISNAINTSPNDKDNSLIIPSDAIIYRTQSRSKQFAFGIFPTKERKPLIYFAGNSETESQRWMANIRQLLRPRKSQFIPGSYSVSMVDNAHSKASGLIGLYGDLVASTKGVFIKDAHSGETIETFDWRELGQFHHSTTEAGKLLQDLVTQGRGPRAKLNRRPLSLSEGDLRISKFEEIQRNYPILSERIDVRILNKSRNSTVDHGEMGSKIYNKLAENVYQPEPSSVPNITDNTKEWSNYPHDRRISNISVASGIYEEIADEVENDKATTSHFSVDRFFHSFESEEPPPLPPRQRCASESMKGFRSQDVLISGRGIISVTSSHNPTQDERNTFALEKDIDTCNYVPMSPRLKDISLHRLQTQASLQENDYVIMR